MEQLLIEEWDNIITFDRKLIFQLRQKIYFKVKNHFMNMHFDTTCDGCRRYESTLKHTLECKS